MSPERHPSFLQLDRLAAGAGSSEVEAHVGGCPRCSGHLQRLSEPVGVPPWARALEKPPRSRWQLLALAGPALACAAALLLVLRSPPELREKGAPAVAVYVEHSGAVSLWDGHRAVSPGDRIRLEISAEGLTHVAVASQGAQGRWQRVFAGESPKMGPLPQSWRLDEAPGPEVLGIALSRGELDERRLSEVLRAATRDAQVWTTILTLPKESR